MSKNIEKNKLNKIVSFFLCLCIMVCLNGCESNTTYKADDIDGNYVYYVKKDYTGIEAREYTLEETETDKKIDELLDELRRNSDDITVVKAIPDSVNIENYELEDGVLKISFDVGYNTLGKSQEILCRSAVVLTMIQLDEVNYVSFSVGDEPLLTSSGDAVGNMDASNFSNGLGGEQQAVNTDSFTIYFANQAGDKLLKYSFDAEYSNSMSKEEYIVTRLIEGPGEEEGYLRTIPDTVQLLNVSTADEICYVTFGENFLTEQAAVPAELVIYSIVNSLSELSYIHKVQITVKNVQDAYYQDISLSQMFTRNLDCVEDDNAQTESQTVKK